MFRYCALFLAAVGVLTQAACKHTPPANVAAMVNGHAITYTDLEKIYQSQYPQQAEAANQDLVMSQKLDLLGNLITNEILLQKAEKLGLAAVDADVDTELNKMRAPFTKEEFDHQLSEKHMTLDDLKTQIRQRLTVEKLINKEITSHISITDADVANFYNANKANFNLKEPQVHMGQILVTPNPDPNIHNLKNSKARNEAEAKSKIEDIGARLSRGEDFALLAQNYSEDPNSAPNGGDMGFITESTLERANPELRNMIMALPPNGMSKIIHTQDGYRILKVYSKEPSGQRDLNDPRVQQNIRETLQNAKDQLLKTAYYETARNSAKVENYLAKSILEGAGQGK
jgi:peptidyl-prolyl cis-trans isomerase SurA